MTDNGFVKVCEAHELKDRRGERFIVNEIEIAVFKVDGEIYALNNICPHQKSAIIYDGFIENGRVVCPAHGWEFDLKTGCLGGMSRGLQTYEVKIVDNDVMVKVEKKEWNW